MLPSKGKTNVWFGEEESSSAWRCIPVVWSSHLPGDGGLAQEKLPLDWSVSESFLNLIRNCRLIPRRRFLCEVLCTHQWEFSMFLPFMLDNQLDRNCFYGALTASRTPVKTKCIELVQHLFSNSDSSMLAKLHKQPSRIVGEIIVVSCDCRDCEPSGCVNSAIGHVYTPFQCHRKNLQYTRRKTPCFDRDLGWDKTPYLDDKIFSTFRKGLVNASLQMPSRTNSYHCASPLDQNSRHAFQTKEDTSTSLVNNRSKLLQMIFQFVYT